MNQPQWPRSGIGFDVHRFSAPGERKLILGGVDIPYERGLLGHSDADVLAHAINDALFGAAAMGDIGHHFPPSDDAFKDADSIKLLSRSFELVAKQGYQLGNVDAVVACEQPKLAKHIDAMRERLADALAADISQVSVKATTTERLGFTGRGEGIAAYATVMLIPINQQELSADHGV